MTAQRRRLLVAWLLALGTVSCGPSQPAADPAADEQAINAVREREITAFLRAQESLHALAHLIGGLVCKRDGEDVPARNFFLGDKIRDAMRNHTRFAGAGTCEDQERSFGSKHSLALLFI